MDTEEAVDPTTLAVVRGYLEEVVDEMDLVQVKAAFSPIVSEMKDRANGLFQVASGETVVQGHWGSPIFITTMQHAVHSVTQWLEKTGQGWHEGDAYLTNDPYSGGTHLQDAKLVAPLFWEGNPLLLLANTGHWMDVGAAQAGAFGPTCRTIYEEGVRLPPIRLVRDEGFVPEVLELIRVNNRLPDLQEGDLRSQYNALLVGRRRLQTLLERYGPQTVTRCVHELDQRSEQQMRDRIAAIPDGTYRAHDDLDNDGVGGDPLHLELVIRVSGSQMVFDFAGSDRACEGPMNLTRPTTITACYTGLKHLFPEIPINAGCFRPVRIEIPVDSILDARPPHAVGGYADVSARVVGLVSQALVEAIPDEAPATSFETGGVAVVSGNRLDGSLFVAAIPYGGGYGASYGSDGLVNGTSVVGMASFPSLEMSERDAPIHWNEFALREGSGGPGTWSGGCGNIYDFSVEVPSSLSVLGDQAVVPPAGVLGGCPGSGNEVTVTVGGKTVVSDLGVKVAPVQLVAHDRVCLKSPGGGGYGYPGARDRSQVARDVELGYISLDEAIEHYGFAP
ncbi:MAG TPA: hydantoinase B/oxoprolinase family protein [Acidimicrobiales bacterium]|jgi:N-methylhydantoinase B